LETQIAANPMEEPLISIALCTYNGAKYLREQLDSITSQTYQRFEIIVVDDCSTDNTFDIVKTYAAQDTRIKCFKNEVNLGFNKNFEKAISLTSGKYIAVSDQDDIWLADKLRLLLDNIKDNWLIFSNSSYLDSSASGKLLDNFKLPNDFRGILLFNYLTGHTTLFHREFLKFIFPFPEKGYYDWWMGFVASYHHRICFLDQALTQYRVHHESVIQKRVDLGGKKLEEYSTISVMLDAFAGYDNLKPSDKEFIDRLKNSYRSKGSRPLSIPLMKIVFKYYQALFPNMKVRKSFSKLNFAFKFSRGVNVKADRE
jgi:glycosyltransferase involved in cell wall biosynthesis